ncbi:MAG: hypothetical protein DWQ47_16480 [Acidobacteria bacterium]|nr:MAG: hypothetical protein DWQ32_03880 [Acidobacteriota bacterium]REK02353.1 MAG: hypothetical protein DWQ38_08260 [Acidobacteriota bacterium]REK13845.1 MAG: hypothetical protein DWQ43_09570 [Acidobacteriota bacterium]REK41840.1 MAG: hypothetical protein DWQ47_16480 [Acidobacteriota bacterium]
MSKQAVIAFLLILLHMLAVSGQIPHKDFLADSKVSAFDVEVDRDYRGGDWTPVLEKVRKKQIVLLGEFNHGSKEVFVTRNGLVKALHEKAGFDVILVESVIGEVAAIDIGREEINGPFLTLGFIGPWRTVEFRELMEFAKARNLSFAGFDVQRTGGSFGGLLSAEAKARRIDPVHFETLEDRFTAVSRELQNSKTEYETVRQKTLDLADAYEELDSMLWDRASDNKSRAYLLVRKTLANRIEYLRFRLQFLKDRDWSRRWKARDSAMADNVSWLIQNLYKDRKIIIIGHNFHIARHNGKEEVMGEFLAQKFGDRMYSLGTFAGNGSYFGNSGREARMSPPDGEKLDLKQIIGNLKGRVNFVDLGLENEANAVFSREMIVSDTFIDLSGSKSMVLSKHFDGLILIDKVSPPELIDWQESGGRSQESNGVGIPQVSKGENRLH